MRLYVHLEAADEAESWTKRLKLPPVDDPDASPSIRSVLLRFISAHTAKFRPNRPLNLSDLDVYVEFQQNAASRRLLPSLDASMALIKDSRDGVMVQEEETCSFELVVIPRTPQRKVLGPPPPLPVQKTSSKCPIQAENRRDGRDPNLQAVLELAAANMKNKKFRLARELYRTVVLPADPENPEALLALGDILMANGQFEAAANEYFLKCWIVHGPTAAAATAEREVGVIEPITASKEDAKLASSSALRLAECYIEMQNHQQALGILDELHAFLHGNDALGRGKAKNEINSFPLGTEERLLTEAQMDVLKARALYNTNIPDNQEKAISLITHLLPNLQAPVLNLDALLVYARIADDRGKKSEALVMVLQVLVGKSKDRAVKETLVSMLKDVGSMERLQQTIPPTSPSAGAAYAYIATILKDFGAIDNSIVCFQQAQVSDPHSASYALNHAHTLEVNAQYREAYNVLISFLRHNRVLTVGNGADGTTQLSAGSFVKILDRSKNARLVKYDDTSTSLEEAVPTDDRAPQWQKVVTMPSSIPPGTLLESVNAASVVPKSAKGRKILLTTLPETELDLLACFFTIVKILFINGHLSALLPLIHVLEPLRIGRDLHSTTIRNEQAYYSCIAQLLSIDERLVEHPLSAPFDYPENTVYVCGDSHTLATSWREINIHGQRTLLRPALVTGLKHWHLRKESVFYPKVNFWRVISSIPMKARVIFLFGEIDCREGILEAVEKCKYESIEEGMKHTIAIFMDTLAAVVEKYEFEACIHPVVPVLDETRGMVVQYNKLFQKQVASSRICKWLDFFDDLVYQSPYKLRPEFRLDGTHLHPSYLVHLEDALSKL